MSVALAVASVGFASPAAAQSGATPFADIASSGPLSHIYIGNELSCQIEHAADTDLQAFPPSGVPGDCGTFLAVGGTLYAPDFVNHNGGTATGSLGTYTPFTPVTQTLVTGSGTSGDPYQVVTTVDAGASGLRIIQTDSYVIGEDHYTTDVQVLNLSGGSRQFVLYRALDCYLSGSDVGYGDVDAATESVACSVNANNSPSGQLLELEPITAGSAYMEDDFSNVWSWIGGKQAFTDTCTCTEGLDNGAGLSWFTTLDNGASTTFSQLTRVTPPTWPSGRFSAMTPERILDTRDEGSPLAPGETRTVAVAGVGDVPFDATAVTMNVTVTQPTEVSFLTVWPAGTPRPLASNLNFVADQTVPNLVTVALGDDGSVHVFNPSATVHVIFDVAGAYVGPSIGVEGRFQPLTPYRTHDTRDGGTPIGPGGTVDLQITGTGGASGVPASGVSAVALNVTATQPSDFSHLTVWPTGDPMPLASNLNLVPGQTVPNRVVVAVGTGGRVTIRNNSGSVHVIVDVNGWFTDSTAASGVEGAFTPLTPARLLDTRDTSTPVEAGTARTIMVAGQGGVPDTGARAVMINVTVTQPSDFSHLTLWPSGSSQPGVSDLNFVPNQTVPNLVIVKLGPDGQVSMANHVGSAHVIWDVVGWFV